MDIKDKYANADPALVALTGKIKRGEDIADDELLIEALAWYRQGKGRYANADFRVSHSGGTYGFVGRCRIDAATLDHLDIELYTGEEA